MYTDGVEVTVTGGWQTFCLINKRDNNVRLQYCVCCLDWTGLDCPFSLHTCNLLLLHVTLATSETAILFNSLHRTEMYSFTVFLIFNVSEYPRVSVPLCFMYLRHGNVLLEETLILSQAVKLFPALQITRSFIAVLTSVRHLYITSASGIRSKPSHSISLRSILLLWSYLRLGLPKRLFPSGFPIKFFCGFSCALLYTIPFHPLPVYFCALLRASYKARLMSTKSGAFVAVN
jgi:hypothetical protein